MSVNQLSFWDNEALETGYRCLSNLELKRAESHFNEALNGAFGKTAYVLRAIETCRDWQQMIEKSNDTNENNGSLNHADTLLSYFVDYSFIPPMKEFRKVLLGHIASILCEVNRMDLRNVETTFDLLLDIKSLAKAESLIREAIKQNPENQQLRYMQAQAQWHNGKKSKASFNYVRLLMLRPHEAVRDRIEDEALQTLMKTYGVAMAPVFGMIYNVTPVIALPHDMAIKDEEHRIAVECYRLILAINQSQRVEGIQASIQSRKKLKKLSPELFEAYLKRLQRQR